MPCGAPPLRFEPDLDVYGPVAFSRKDSSIAYFASPNAAGMVELWAADTATLLARRVSSFSRDAYAPSVSTAGTITFKVQSYRTFVADVPAEGGDTRQLTSFQSETPSYHPSQPLLSFTFGTWRRVVDDGNYPDIAQDIGVIDLKRPMPVDAPQQVAAGINTAVSTPPVTPPTTTPVTPAAPLAAASASAQICASSSVSSRRSAISTRPSSNAFAAKPANKPLNSNPNLPP